MIKIVNTARIILGIMFILFGLNGLSYIYLGSGFIPMPPYSPEFAPIMGGLFQSKFVMPSAKIIQVTCGVLFLTNRFVNLAILLLAPVLYSILAAHLIVADFAGAPLGFIALICWVILAYQRKENFKLLLS